MRISRNWFSFHVSLGYFCLGSTVFEAQLTNCKLRARQIKSLSIKLIL